MAITAPNWSTIMEQMAYETVIDEYVAMNRQFITTGNYRSTDELRAAGKEIADRLRDEGKLLSFLEATAPRHDPCPECGRY